MNYKINLFIYPFLQIFCFAMAWYFVKTSWLFSAGFIFLAALSMSFSLHITYHHHVHHSTGWRWLDRFFDFLITLFLGLPFHFYKLQHINHHQFDNKLGDITSTYIQKNGQRVARKIIPYIFLWILDGWRIEKYKQQAMANGYFSVAENRKMKMEVVLNLIFIIGLFYWDWRAGCLFGAMFYLGWSMIALHNYGQHLPTPKHQIAFSYYGKLYNAIFMNNGLHYEHHLRPSLSYWDL
ncbi:MAG TPA: hypothetical protein ENJ53_01240, partial [Phaeodactylibacter sp.]|nr:hypothetical protein [Phaeodactylibacter sp.]